MQSLTNAHSNPMNSNENDFDGDDSSQRTSNWRHSKLILNRVKSFDPSEFAGIDQSDVHSTNTAAAPAASSHRFRSHNAFNKFVQQTIDFARRTSKNLFVRRAFFFSSIFI